jgi:nanoRNase/pAp phosphatase (c-di-AMP/oligoRNAs hydrolase)
LKVVLVGYGPINRRVAALLRERGFGVLVVEEDAGCAQAAMGDGLECVVGLVPDRDVAPALDGADAFVLMDLDPLRVDKLGKSLRRGHPRARIVAPDVQVKELPFLETFTAGGQSVRVGLDAIAQAAVGALEDHLAMRSADRLVEVLRAGPPEGEVAVFTHNDPDPDAIAAGMAMLRICQELGLPARLYHGGALYRLENRFFARLVEAPLNAVTTEEAAAVVSRAGRVVLVDAGKAGEHNVLPPESVPNVVLDHHSTNRETISADYSDVRPAVGSASTLLTLYLQGLGVAPGKALAAALLFGLRTDTDHLRRNAFPTDARVSVYLAGLADAGLMDLLERPPRSAEAMDAIGRAVLARTRVGDHVFTWCGEVSSRDDLPQAADFLMQEDDVAAVFAFGSVGDTVHLSARAVEGGPHVGEITKRAMADVGTGGGHPTMAGGSIVPRKGPGMDVGAWVQGDLYQAFAEAAGLGVGMEARASRPRRPSTGGG